MLGRLVGAAGMWSW
jgi:hypothetical protein